MASGRVPNTERIFNEFFNLFLRRGFCHVLSDIHQSISLMKLRLEANCTDKGSTTIFPLQVDTSGWIPGSTGMGAGGSLGAFHHGGGRLDRFERGQDQ
jgi:hypothetical protein